MEAFLDWTNTLDEVSRVSIAAPASPTRTSGSEVIMSRISNTTDVLNSVACPQVACERLQNNIALSLVASAYNPQENSTFYEALADGSPYSDEEIAAAANELNNGLLYVDADGNTAHHLLRFLAIECTSYQNWASNLEFSPSGPIEEGIFRIFEPCATISGEFPSLGGVNAEFPDGVTVCLAGGDDDPVSGTFELEGYSSNSANVPSTFNVGGGHFPESVFEEMRAHVIGCS